jgi:hypothetical protein
MGTLGGSFVHANNPGGIQPVAELIFIRFDNTGSTPARIASWNATATLLTTSKGKFLPPGFLFAEKEPDPRLAGPHEGEVVSPHNPIEVSVAVPPEMFEDFKKGTKQPFVYGHISYRDVFKTTHTLLYCFRYVGPGDDLSACPEHNQEYDGDYSPPKFVSGIAH